MYVCMYVIINIVFTQMDLTRTYINALKIEVGSLDSF